MQEREVDVEQQEIFHVTGAKLSGPTGRYATRRRFTELSRLDKSERVNTRQNSSKFQQSIYPTYSAST